MGFIEKSLKSLNVHSIASPAAASVLRSEYADMPAIARVLPEYTSGLPRYVTLLNDALKCGACANLRRLVHQLRGTGGTYGFPDISLVAEMAEAAIEQQFDFPSVAEKVYELIDLIQRVDGYQHTNPSVNQVLEIGTIDVALSEGKERRAA